MRGNLLGGNFSRWGEGMNRFLASVGNPIIPAVEILVWVQHLYIYSHTLTYSLLTCPGYCWHATKMTSLCTTIEFFQNNLGQTNLQTFKTYVKGRIRRVTSVIQSISNEFLFFCYFDEMNDFKTCLSELKNSGSIVNI